MTVNTESRTQSRVYLLIFISALIFFFGTYFPKIFYALMQEDYIAEWLTFYLFSFSGIIILIHLYFAIREKTYGWVSPDFLIPLIIAMFCLVVAGEEISWGQRIFAFKPPDFFLEKNYQQELNIHNLFKGNGIWGISVESKHLVMLISFSYGIFFPVFTRYFVSAKNLSRHFPAFYMMPFFVMVIIMEQIYPIKFTGEACEMFLGFIFLIHIFDTYCLNTIKKHPFFQTYQLSIMIFFIALLGVITAPLLKSLSNKFLVDTEATIQNELALIQDDFLDPLTKKQKIFKKRKVHKRVYTAIEQNYFRFLEKSRFLGNEKNSTGSKKYYLDTWNSPYWIYYNREKKVVIFYSFGSNRKRDSNFDQDITPKGDDVAVLISLKPQ